MTGKGRNGPRERQTMSGILGEARDVERPAPSVGPAPVPAPVTAALPASVIIDHLSLWERLMSVADREFEKDDPPSGRSAREGGRDRNGR